VEQTVSNNTLCKKQLCPYQARRFCMLMRYQAYLFRHMKEIVLLTDSCSTCVTHISDWLVDLSFHSKSFHVPLDKCFMLFSLTDSEFYKSQNTALWCCTNRKNLWNAVCLKENGHCISSSVRLWGVFPIRSCLTLSSPQSTRAVVPEPSLVAPALAP